MKRLALMVVLLVPVVASCKPDYEFDPPSEDERVAKAEERITSQLFDSITWVDQEVRLSDGNGVYAAKCRRCHGTLGSGGTDYALKRDLEVPSLVVPDWRWADSLGSVRRSVFTGHSGGMPTWGVAGISPREIDAASYYILFGLRPDAAAGSEG